jgi:hypothetical protein
MVLYKVFSGYKSDTLETGNAVDEKLSILQILTASADLFSSYPVLIPVLLAPQFNPGANDFIGLFRGLSSSFVSAKYLFSPGYLADINVC